MDIILLDYYLRLFSIIANLFPGILPDNIRDFLRSTVLKELNEEIKQEGIRLFNEYYLQYANLKDSSQSESIGSLLQTVRQIDEKIPRKQKFQILLRLLLFEKLLLRYSHNNTDLTFSQIIEFVIDEFKISTPEYQNCKGFISEKFYQVHDMQKLLIVAEKKTFQLDIPFLQRNNFQGQLYFLYIESSNTILFVYKGPQHIFLNKQPVYVGNIYFLYKGAAIKGDDFEPVYYNQVLRKFKMRENVNLKVEVTDLEFKFKNSNNGIHKLSLDLEAGQLVGIIGRSGVGKSTLINLLIGSKRPDKGTILINENDLNVDKNKLDGIIGYVSQDDLLIEELSVFSNLLLNARLCFGNLPDDRLEEKVKNILVDLDLYDVKDLKVGTPLNRLISGGQRKKLNIALELIREPWILFADEPTSGLSSSDSEEIMHLFSEQTSKGKIVVVNIHQPSSDIFKLFDKIIVLDKEGYPVYFGNPMDAIPYFNDYYQRVILNSDVCNVCENVNAEAIFRVLEEKKTNEFGEDTKERKTTPQEWHSYFLSQIPVKQKQIKHEKELPEIKFNKPDPLKQFWIFTERNVLAKLANYQYIALTLLVSPLLAIVLSLLCRYNNINENLTEYSFAFNENIPSYLFMSVIVALFLGLIMSAEEIIRDRKVLLRESYLKLSKLSYLNSKVSFVFGISALQSFLYVIIGNAILGIKGMTLDFWLILFSTSCFASLVGLFISSILNTVIAIYILVPMIIVPQMLLSGVVVNYDKLNKFVSSQEFVPLVGDAMASRWAYEGLVVRQFSANEYQRNFFEVEKKESNIKFNLIFVVPEIKKAIQNQLKNVEKKPGSDNLLFISNELNNIKNTSDNFVNFSSQFTDLNLLSEKLENYNNFLSKELNRVSAEKDSITNTLVNKYGGVEYFLVFKNYFYNSSIADLVLKRKDLEPYAIANNKIIRHLEPIYQIPKSSVGRAHYLTASKIVGKNQVDTFLFNLVAIWIMTLITYALLFLFFIFNKPKLKPKKQFMRLKFFGIFIGLALFFACCTSNNNQQAENKSVKDSSKVDSLGNITYLLLSPNEILEQIIEGPGETDLAIANPYSNAEKYITTQKISLNLGVYIADFTYLNLKQDKVNSLEYFKTIRDLSHKNNIYNGIDEGLFERIQRNLMNNDSLIAISQELYYNMSNDLEEAGRQNIFSFIAAGALVESMYLSVMNVPDYQKYKEMGQKILDQKELIDNFYDYMSAYNKEPEINLVLKQLDVLRSILKESPDQQKVSVSKDKKGHIVVKGGKEVYASEASFKMFKDSVIKVRSDIISIK